jgi:hypothetical protein
MLCNAGNKNVGITCLSSVNIIRVIKTEENVARMGEMKNSYNI